MSAYLLSVDQASGMNTISGNIQGVQPLHHFRPECNMCSLGKTADEWGHDSTSANFGKASNSVCVSLDQTWQSGKSKDCHYAQALLRPYMSAEDLLSPLPINAGMNKMKPKAGVYFNVWKQVAAGSHSLILYFHTGSFKHIFYKIPHIIPNISAYAFF